MTISKDYLDELAASYHLNQDSHSDMFIEDMMQEYVAFWLKEQLLVSGAVLELGYGNGIITDFLVSLGYPVTIVEGSKKLCEKIVSKYQKRCHVVHDLFENYETNETFDYILACFVLEHVDDPAAILKKYAKFLSPNGTMIIIVPNKESLHRQLAVDMGIQDKLDTLSPRDHLVGHQRVYSLDTLENDVALANLNIVDKKGFFLKLLPNSMMVHFDESLIRALNSISNKVPEHLLANIAVVVKQ